MEAASYWIGVASEDAVAAGVAGGYVEVNDGKAGPLERMRPGDGFAWYSPRSTAKHGEATQRFTAIGRIGEGGIVQADACEGGRFRRAFDALRCEPAPVRPLIGALTFIRSKEHWGAPFRYGMLRIPAADFARIARAMGREPSADFGIVDDAIATAST